MFEADKNSEGCYTALRFSDKLSSPSDITEALEAVFQQLRRDSVFPCLKGWRNEVHTITQSDLKVEECHFTSLCRGML